ncbi:MAG: hypothetical protein QOJ61_51 [Mycobacterium sp.]|nr:hypothetical protein [Mycobacterium sp.]
MATGLPTLSQIHAWDVDHLVEAAEHWHSTADRWESVYGQVWQQSLGMDWHGQARDALIDRTTADRAMVSSKADQLRDAALTARKAAGDISAAQRSVLYKVDDAHQAGFVVGEDLSLTDTRRSRDAAELAARQAQAQALAADIRSRAAQLLAADSEVGAKLTATAGDVGSLNFNEKPVAHDGKIQLVDWKQAPAPAPGPGPTGQDLHNAVKNLPRGRRPIIGEIRSEDDLRRLWNWAAEGATERAPGSTYKGTERVLRDGTIVGLRPSDSGLTLDFNPPDGPYEKIHVNTARGGIPDIPVRAAGPPEELAPRAHAPAESAPMESAPVEPAAPRAAPVAPEPSAPIGPPGSNPFPHFIESPHFHRGPPVVGRDDLGELPE